MAITKQSRANLSAADRFGVMESAGAALVWVELNGIRSFLHDSHGPVRYASEASARRSVRRLRPGLSECP